MPALQIRDLPSPLHQLLVERARLERRSISQQATVLLAEALQEPLSHKLRRQKLIAELKDSNFEFAAGMTPEELIREDRDR